MRTRVSKWGNSLAVRIPRTYVDRLGLSEGSRIDIVSAGDVLVLKRPKYTLKQLLANVTADNLHQETDTGPVVGREAW